MKIGFATSDWALGALGADGNPTLGGAGHYRIGLPSAELERHGVPVAVGTLVERNGILGVMGWPNEDNGREVHTDCDVLVIQRYMNHDLPEAMLRAKANGQLIINDLDDWFFGLSTKNRAFATSHPRIDPEANTNHYRKVLAASSLITCSTPYLAHRVEQMFRTPTLVLRNAIDAHRFDRDRIRHAPPVVGWIGAQPWRSGDLETLRGVLGPWLKRSGWRFHHGGDVPESNLSAAALAGIPDDVLCSTRSMVPIAEYPELFDDLDVGLVPLRSCSFNEAKSAIKGMEYAAAGVSFVAASTDEYRWLAGSCLIGRVAKKARDWQSALDVLSDPTARREEAARNRKALGPLLIENRWIDWYDAYRDLMAQAAA